MTGPDSLDEPSSLSFPSVEDLQLGVLRGTVVWAIYLLPKETHSDSWMWHGHILEVSDGGGTVGCLSFAAGLVVGAFCDVESDRKPYDASGAAPGYRAEAYFAAASAEVRSIASRDVLPSTLFASWLGDNARLRDALEHDTLEQLEEASPELFAPVITAALWSEGDTLTSSDPWTEVYRHGAHLLSLELADLDLALAEWENGMQLVPEQVALARHLYERRRAYSSPVMALTGDEYAQLIAYGSAQLPLVRGLLAAVGIALPGESVPPEQVALRWS